MLLLDKYVDRCSLPRYGSDVRVFHDICHWGCLSLDRPQAPLLRYPHARRGQRKPGGNQTTFHSKLDLDRRVEQTQDDVGVVKADLPFINDELKAKVDREEFAALENRSKLT